MWERAHTKLQAALPLQISLDQLQATGIASLEKRVREGTEECATAAAQTNQVSKTTSY